MSIIPLPVHCQLGEGAFDLPDTVQVRADGPGAEPICSYLLEHLRDQLGLDAQHTTDARSAAVSMQCGEVRACSVQHTVKRRNKALARSLARSLACLLARLLGSSHAS